ncbi:MAG: PhoH family protein [Saprospiraceae bacterium]|nr:PhoH family protein [Saprospiraceae bacterium]
MSEIILKIDGINPLELYGEKNSKLNLVKKAFPALQITSRGENLKISGEKKDAQKAKSKIEQLVKLVRNKTPLSTQKVKDVLNGNMSYELEQEEAELNGPTNANVIVYGRNAKAIKARTRNQKRMVQMSEANDILFAIGPAGTGKTYTAVALAVRALKTKMVRKIILTRPAVEAGENLGFLPGDLKDKIDPYLRPLYDALDDMLPVEKLNHFMQNRIIEVAPLAFMRGRTLDNAFIILDEAQNATSTQIKMFLTRLGPSAKCIITGDLSQIDLPRNQKSGLYRALDILSDVNGIAKIFLTSEDVVRHKLVKQIIDRYEKAAESWHAERAEKEEKEKNDKS